MTDQTEDLGRVRRTIRASTVVDATGLNRVTLWRKIAKGQFPAPVQLSENSIGFYEDEIAAWLESRPRVSYRSPEAA